MNFKPCLLIPIYNHGATIGTTVDRLLPYGLPIYIVDDGSAAATAAGLDTLAQEQALVRLSRLATNSGKGAAVMHGLRLAQRAGFTHALQIDADGQHDTADVPRFLERGAAFPQAMVCGTPVYDDSVPKGRRYGRYVTHFWVWVETLSLAIGDSMCGFRLYPLAASCALIDDVRLPQRMDFDTAIAVRLFWRGVRCENLATRVVYPPGGLSHFALWRDNVLISKMHCRLVLAMLPRLPLLLWRRLARNWNRIAPRSAHWSSLAERGGGLGLRIVFCCYRRLGERATQWLLYPIVAYFLLTGGEARAASLDYLRRVAARQAKPAPGWKEVFRHMQSFAQSSLDKLAAWLGGIDGGRVDFPNRAEFDRLLDSGRGAVLIGSHLGNLEMTRALAVDESRAVVNAVVYTDHAQRFNQTLARANANFGVNLIQVSQLGPQTAIMLKDKVDRGELLVIVGDRTPPAQVGSRVSTVDFLGQPASFAQGPLILASLLDCPVYLFFCLRDGERYRIDFEPFAERIVLPRREREARLHSHLQRYAQRLEAYCLKAPYQWFNFYDFWRNDTASQPGKG